MRAEGVAHHTADHLANERTLLAWIRTSVSIIVFGFVVAKFGITLRQLLEVTGRAAQSTNTGASAYLGAAFVAIGVAFTVGAWVHYARTRVAIEQDRFGATSPAATLLAIVVALFGVAVIGYLLTAAAAL